MKNQEMLEELKKILAHNPNRIEAVIAVDVIIRFSQEIAFYFSELNKWGISLRLTPNLIHQDDQRDFHDRYAIQIDNLILTEKEKTGINIDIREYLIDERVKFAYKKVGYNISIKLGII